MNGPDYDGDCRAVPTSTDVLIVGGGPAGLAAAIALRQAGLQCVVVEALPPGIDKACGEGLMPEALAALASLGVRVQPTDGHPFHGIRFVNSWHQVDGYFSNGCGMGVRRTRLHTLLAERAVSTGAVLLWRSRVVLPAEGCSKYGGEAIVNGVAVSYRWLVGADGQASSVRHWAGLESGSKATRRSFRSHYPVTPWSDQVEVHWGATGQIYITPVAQGCISVVFIGRGAEADRANLLADFPTIAARLSGAVPISRQRGAISTTRRLRRVAVGCVALIGDASGSADSITGEGLAVTFLQALALAESLALGSLAPYRRAHARIGRPTHRIGAAMLTLNRWPAFERWAMRALAASPGLFSELLNMRIGAQGLLAVVLRHGPTLAAHLLRVPFSANPTSPCSAGRRFSVRGGNHRSVS